MLTDSSFKGRKSPKKRTALQKGKFYSDSQKMELVKLWLVTGNLSASAVALDIELKTAQYWRYSQWWEDLCKEIRAENRIQLSSKLRNIANKALDVTADRLENGDFVLNNRTGQIVRKPVNANIAHKIASDLVDKTEKLDKLPTESLGNEKVLDTLAKLAAKFEEFANRKKIVHVTDVVMGDFQERSEERVLANVKDDENMQEMSGTEASGDVQQEEREEQTSQSST